MDKCSALLRGERLSAVYIDDPHPFAARSPLWVASLSVASRIFAMDTRLTSPQQAGNALQALLRLPHVDARNDLQVAGAVLDYLRNQFPMDADLLAQGAASGMARRMREQPHRTLDQSRFDDLVMQLSKYRGVDLGDARWVVAAWAHALGIGLPSGPTPLPPPPQRTGKRSVSRLVLVAILMIVTGIVSIVAVSRFHENRKRMTESEVSPVARPPTTSDMEVVDPAMKKRSREGPQAARTEDSRGVDERPGASVRARQQSPQYYASSATIVIFSNGYSVNGEGMTEAQLKSFLDETGRRNHDCRIVIHLNAGASAESADRVKQLCVQSGLKKIFTKNLQYQ